MVANLLFYLVVIKDNVRSNCIFVQGSNVPPEDFQ
jgi:hypothetical protein